MKIPDRINARWIDTLVDDQLITAEAQLHAVFRRQESVEKTRTGTRYMLLQGPADLVNAWQRWLLVNNETRSRGLVVHHRA
jgi:hypothetical protein